MPKTVSVKEGVNQTVNIHIHEKSKQKKRRQKRRKVSGGGAIRTLNRFVPASSSRSSASGFAGFGEGGGLPQVRFAKQQLIALPEGDKALGLVGKKRITEGEQENLHKKLIKDTVREYEAEVRGNSTQERELPILDLTGDTPPSTKPKISRIGQLWERSINHVLQNRRAEAIADFGIDTTGKSKKEITKLIRMAHANAKLENELQSVIEIPDTPENI